MNKKVTWSIVVIIVLAIIVWAGYSSKSAPEAKTFKIGVVLPLSGPAAAMGEASKKSVELMFSSLTEAERSRVSVIYADDQLDPKQTVSVTQKLIDVDRVNALVVYSSPSSVAASYVAEKAGIPMIGLGNSPEINGGKQWVVRYMLGPQAQARAIIDLLLKNKYKKVAMMWNQSDGPKSVHDELAKILPQEGYTVVVDESVTKAETDFKTSISKIRAVKPEVIIAYISPQVGVFAKQAKDLGSDIPLVSGPPFDIVEQIKAAQGGLDNQLYVSNDNVSFIDAYYAAYNSYPTIAGDYLYDAVKQLIKIAGERDHTNIAIMKELRKDFSGVSGKYLYNGDGSFNLQQVVKKWDGSKFVEVK